MVSQQSHHSAQRQKHSPSTKIERVHFVRELGRDLLRGGQYVLAPLHQLAGEPVIVHERHQEHVHDVVGLRWV